MSKAKRVVTVRGTVSGENPLGASTRLASLTLPNGKRFLLSDQYPIIRRAASCDAEGSVTDEWIEQRVAVDASGVPQWERCTEMPS